VAVTVEVLIDSINGLTESGAISKEFIGVILLPIVVATAHCGENLYDLYERHASDTNSSVEHFTAVRASLEDRLHLSLSVAIGSSIVRSFPRHLLSVIVDYYPANRALCYSVRFITHIPSPAVHPYSCRLIVILGWILGKPLSLLFDPLESVVLFLSGTSLLQRVTQ